MNILFCDDQPNQIRLFRPVLEAARHTVFEALDLRSAWLILNAQKANKNRIHLVVIDLMLDRYEVAFKTEQALIEQANPDFHSPSGQALGLRLWQQTPRVPYCYLSTEPQAWWVAGIKDEFTGVSDSEKQILLLKKMQIKAATIPQQLEAVVALWKNKGWCDDVE